MASDPLWLAVAVGAAATLALYGLAALLRELLRRARWSSRRRRAHRAEKEAEHLLGRAGYRVEVVQPRTAWTLLLDGEPQRVDLRADLLVTRGGRRYVAEVKLGNVAPRIETPTTRRQLLEYRVAYDVDGVLLVDMAARTIRKVEFPLLEDRPPTHGLLVAAALVAGVMILVALILRR